MKLLGIFLLGVGCLTLISSVISVAAGGEQLRKTQVAINQQIIAGTMMMKADEAALGVIQKMQLDLNRQFTELEQLLESPGIRFGYSVQGLLGLSSMFAGLGFLKKQAWVVNLVKAQAAVAVIFYLWWGFASPLVTYRNSLSALMFDLLSKAAPWTAQVQINRTMRIIEQVSLWGGLLFVVAWNGFLYWFVRQSSVRKACGAK